MNVTTVLDRTTFQREKHVNKRAKAFTSWKTWLEGQFIQEIGIFQGFQAISELTESIQDQKLAFKPPKARNQPFGAIVDLRNQPKSPNIVENVDFLRKKSNFEAYWRGCSLMIPIDNHRIQSIDCVEYSVEQVAGHGFRELKSICSLQC